jgi:hypothetical protein
MYIRQKEIPEETWLKSYLSPDPDFSNSDPDPIKNCPDPKLSQTIISSIFCVIIISWPNLSGIFRHV